MKNIGNAIYDLCMDKITEEEFREFVASCTRFEMEHYILVEAALQKDRGNKIESLIEEHGGEVFSKYYSQDFVHFAAGGIRI